MTSQTGQQIITIHILPNILRSKRNETMKFGQLIEYKMRNIFLEKLNTKCGRKTSPRPFTKKSKFSISLNQQSELYCMSKLRSTKIEKKIKTKVLTTCFHLI